jgi:small subunit ribosomal protein S3
MGKKTSPTAFRIPTIFTWRSRWFEKGKRYGAILKEDCLIRDFIKKRLKNAGLERIDIERSLRQVSIIVSTSRPGMVIGRGGEEIERLQAAIVALVNKARRVVEVGKKAKAKGGPGGEAPRVRLEIQEVRSPDTSAMLVAERMVQEIQKRVQFRRVLRQTLERVSQEKGVGGVRLQVSGRLDGSEMSRTEWLAKGRLPLSSLRADIDFAKATAYCSYGTVGVKVWIYKGEKFQ